MKFDNSLRRGIDIFAIPLKCIAQTCFSLQLGSVFVNLIKLIDSSPTELSEQFGNGFDLLQVHS